MAKIFSRTIKGEEGKLMGEAAKKSIMKKRKAEKKKIRSFKPKKPVTGMLESQGY